MIELGKKYNRRTLFRMKQFYLTFKDEKVSPVATQLSWSHFCELLPLKDKNKINYYIRICEDQNLSKRKLREKIKNKEYERLDDETKLKLINNEKPKVQDFIKKSYTY